MKEFLLSALSNSILAVDISGADRRAALYPSREFATWAAAEKFFLDLGATRDILDTASAALKENGLAKLSF